MNEEKFSVANITYDTYETGRFLIYNPNNLIAKAVRLMDVLLISYPNLEVRVTTFYFTRTICDIGSRDGKLSPRINVCNIPNLNPASTLVKD